MICPTEADSEGAASDEPGGTRGCPRLHWARQPGQHVLHERRAAVSGQHSRVQGLLPQ